jgi:CRISPR-associated protein Cas1
MDQPLRTDGALDAMPHMGVRNLHNFIYCPRLFYFQWVENVFQENADTVAGSHIHRNVDAPSRLEDPKTLGLPEGSKLRSLRLESETLGLIGVVDIVEGGPDGAEVVDYKKGSARRDAEGERVAKEPDAMQVAAHALLLAEHGVKAARGAIYYAADKRRVPVEFTDGLFSKVRQAIADARQVAASGQCPPPLQHDPRCLYCSAYPICLPNESAFWREADVASKPPEIETPPRPENDEGEVLIVQKAGAQVGCRAEQLVVTYKDQELAKAPVHQVRAIYLFGAVQLSAHAAQACLEQGSDVAYFAPSGRFLGLLRGLPASGVDARLGQYRLFGEPAIRLQLAREVIRAKIHNQRVLLMRNGEVAEKTLKELEKLRDETIEAADVTTLLGLEGRAAALYFGAFATMLKDNLGFAFNERNRRPPRDPVNALLSLGYSMLCKELAGVCHAVGLDPFLGFMHQPRYGRPALALDLMEEFRPLIADSVAISLVNRGEIGQSDFIISSAGVFLNDHGRRAFWEAYARRLDTEISHPQFGYKMAYRRMFEVQARQLWRFLRGEATGYHGFTTR